MQHPSAVSLLPSIPRLTCIKIQPAQTSVAWLSQASFRPPRGEHDSKTGPITLYGMFWLDASSKTHHNLECVCVHLCAPKCYARSRQPLIYPRLPVAFPYQRRNKRRKEKEKKGEKKRGWKAKRRCLYGRQDTSLLPSVETPLSVLPRPSV